MRTWFVHPSYLCRQRVLGQHREIHMQAAAIQKKKMQSHPLTKYWQQKANWNAVVLYHDLIVLEMKIRGYNGHSTPLLIDETDRSIKLPPIKPHYLTRDITDLQCRWLMHGQHGKPRAEIPDRALVVPHIFSNLKEELPQTSFSKLTDVTVKYDDVSNLLTKQPTLIDTDMTVVAGLIGQNISAVQGLLID